MEAGKLDELSLRHKVFPFTGVKREEVVLRAAVGEDSAALGVGADYQLVLSSDPITAASKKAGSLAVHVSCNDVASNGAEPLAVMLTLLLPEGNDQDDVELIMRDADMAAKSLNVEIIGGHTEFTHGLKQSIISATAIGKVKIGKLISKGGAKAGHDIVLTKGTGIEGTAILLSDYADFWQDKITAAEMQCGLQMAEMISIVPEARIAADNGASAMHDVTEGGVLGGVYELSIGADVGIEIYEERIPLNAITEKMCRVLAIDPLRLISSGSLLIAVPNGNLLVEKLQEKNITASVIGRIIAEKEKKFINKHGRTEEILPPRGDEIWCAVKKIKLLTATD